MAQGTKYMELKSSSEKAFSPSMALQPSSSKSLPKILVPHNPPPALAHPAATSLNRKNRHESVFSDVQPGQTIHYYLDLSRAI